MFPSCAGVCADMINLFRRFRRVLRQIFFIYLAFETSRSEVIERGGPGMASTMRGNPPLIRT